MRQDVCKPGAGVPSGERTGAIVGRLIVVAVAVAALGGCAALAVHAMRPGPAQQQVAAPRAVTGARVAPALALKAPAMPSAAAASPIDEFGPTTEARGFISAQLCAFDALTQVWQSGLMSREDFDAAAMQSAGGAGSVSADLQQQPMNGGYALSREALLYGLQAVDHMWRTTVQNGTVDTLDYQVAQASLAVSARHVPGVPNKGP